MIKKHSAAAHKVSHNTVQQPKPVKENASSKAQSQTHTKSSGHTNSPAQTTLKNSLGDNTLKLKLEAKLNASIASKTKASAVKVTYVPADQRHEGLSRFDKKLDKHSKGSNGNRYGYRTINTKEGTIKPKDEILNFPLKAGEHALVDGNGVKRGTIVGPVKLNFGGARKINGENHKKEFVKPAERNFAADSLKRALFSKLEASRVRQPNPEQIARRYAPILVLPQGKYNLPTDPNSYIANSSLREDRSFRPDKEHGNNINGSRNDNFNASDVGRVTKGNYFLDLNNDKRGTLGSKDSPIFYQFDKAGSGKPPRITYHIFYPYNDAPKAGPIDLNHEGDWERVTINLDPKTYKPVDVLYSAHNGTPKPVPYKDVRDSKTNRPLVYVATGSHANYTKPGRVSLQHGAAHDQTVVDRNRDGKINRRDGAVFFDTARDLREVTSQAWYPKTGKGLHWGEIGSSGHSSGPYGPSRDKGAVGD